MSSTAAVGASNCSVLWRLKNDMWGSWGDLGCLVEPLIIRTGPWSDSFPPVPKNFPWTCIRPTQDCARQLRVGLEDVGQAAAVTWTGAFAGIAIQRDSSRVRPFSSVT